MNMATFKKRILVIALTVSVLLCSMEGFFLTGSATEAIAPSVGVGDGFMVALNTRGEAYAWGDNTNGTLGNGTFEDASAPTAVSLPDGRYFTEISVGQDHALALADNGAVYAWGSNGYGQCGDGAATVLTTPAKVVFSEETTVVAVAAGAYFSLALSDEGAVYAWGYNNFWQLGRSVEDVGLQNHVPQRIAGTEETFITAVFAGETTAAAITFEGDVYLWGNNGDFQLGSDTGAKLLPYRLTAVDNVKDIALGIGYTSILLADGSVRSCGKNKYGQFGNGATSADGSAILKAASFDGSFVSVSAAESAVIALTADGTLYTAGMLPEDESASVTAEFTRLSVESGARVGYIAAAYGNAAAILTDGTVIAWGANADGQLGNGALTESASPSPILCDDGSVLNLGAPFASGHSTTVKATVSVPAPTYTITIPTEVDLGNLSKTGETDPDRIKSTSFTIAASGISNLPDGHAVVVAVTPPSGAFVLENGAGAQLPYGIYRTASESVAVAVGGAVAEFTEDGSTAPQIRVDQSQISASGDYEGVLNFSISVEELTE